MNRATDALQKTASLLEKTADKEQKWRPVFHISPKTGWLNDPNGLCQKDGLYHIFFQYSPFETRPGINYWGHYTTPDFINYTYQRPALCSDEAFDCHGVYSGSALVEEGMMTLFYTGNVKLPGDYDYVNNGREHNTVMAMSRDGYIFDKKKLLMKNSDYPNDVTCHVRDPKVWKENGKYYMILGSRRFDDVGEVLLYSSDNKTEWKLENRITTENKLGYMWECPDVYTLNGKTFLSISPQGVEADGMRFNNVYQSGYMQVSGDLKGEYTLGEFEEYDCGFDFYAPQTFEDENGRRILIGWLGLPDIDEYYQNPCDRYGWQHMLTIPRVLNEKNGRVTASPIPEMKKMRCAHEIVNAEGHAEIKDRTVFELEMHFEQADKFEIIVRNGCILSWKDGVFSMSFNEIGCGRTVRSCAVEYVKDIRVFADESSIEVFINDGEKVFSSRYYPSENMKGIEILCYKIKADIWNISGFNGI